MCIRDVCVAGCAEDFVVRLMYNAVLEYGLREWRILLRC